MLSLRWSRLGIRRTKGRIFDSWLVVVVVRIWDRKRRRRRRRRRRRNRRNGRSSRRGNGSNSRRHIKVDHHRLRSRRSRSDRVHPKWPHGSSKALLGDDLLLLSPPEPLPCGHVLCILAIPLAPGVRGLVWRLGHAAGARVHLEISVSAWEDGEGFEQGHCEVVMNVVRR